MTGGATEQKRAALWSRFGEPAEQIGSVNDPRSRLEYGVRWNEKWIYYRGDQVERVILWNRYDLVGVFLLAADGAATADPAAA